MSADLIAIARAIMSPQAEAAIDASLASATPVKLLPPRTMRLLEDTLAKGAVRMLARLGGARAVVRADTGSIKPARVYDVRPVPVLAFGKYTFELLRWMTRTALGVMGAAPFTLAPATAGDELVAYLAHRLVAGRRFERNLALSVTSPLATLGFARAIARANVTPPVPAFDALLARDEGRVVVECLAGDLAQRWATSASWGTEELDAEVALRIASHERATLDAFADALAKIERWDLATFLVDAARTALPPGERAERVAARAAPPVRAGGTLRVRTEARQRSGALFHAAARLSRTYESSARVGFIDEGYDVAQALLTSWSHLGREGFGRAAAVVTELGSLG
ncbi:MAG: hypothetical protein KIT84_36695 [Labilithrix sp.]|nr:hypothetical protein [Labilithrix sp.]MCW5816595.1 hypothetical protein [Labilithrix sp.]